MGAKIGALSKHKNIPFPVEKMSIRTNFFPIYLGGNGARNEGM